uniref:Uncharacterized protein n=1 Tax=Glossina palpalis gambiensis TaxID=67801 RepID=A0A1B0AR91_9MUSC
MEDINKNYLSKKNNESDCSSIKLLAESSAQKKRFCIYSDSSSDHSNEKIAANNSTRRKRRHNPDSEKMIFRFGKKCFKDTYHISDGRLYDCCNKEQVSLLIDHRGRHAPGNKIDHPDDWAATWIS